MRGNINVNNFQTFLLKILTTFVNNMVKLRQVWSLIKTVVLDGQTLGFDVFLLNAESSQFEH